MNINRRHFTQALACLPLLAQQPLWAAQASNAGQTNGADTSPFHLLSSASKNRDGQYQLQIVRADKIISYPLPSRAHQVIEHPHQPWVAVFARRPGEYVDLVDTRSGEQVLRLDSEAGFHFYGHGAFANDGRWLITSENHYATGAGYLVVRDLEQQGKVIRRYRSHGIGPHQIALMPDGDTVVVANGGIKTHPDSGRKKLNLETMKPSLAYISVENGELLEQQFLPEKWHQLSIRHLAVNQTGQVSVVMQYQGEGFNEVPLVATHQRGHSQRGSALQTLWAPSQVNRAMKHYCGSVAYERSGRFAMVSSPRGNLLTLWDMQQQQFITALKCRDGCGVGSYKAKHFVVSNGLGEVFEYTVGDTALTPLRLPANLKLAWDNHLSVS